ncbi:MAG: hypothetical protein K2L14_06745 [Duncaniella sp.]|nr:hypothetical protein [Duncaniella sp.]
MKDTTTRGNLSKTFLKRLTEGDLNTIIKQIIDDNELDIQVRDNYLNVYYKGGNILRIKPQKFQFDKYYFYLGHPKGFPKSHVDKVANDKPSKINPRTTDPIPTLTEARQIVSELDEKHRVLMNLLPESPDIFIDEAKSVMDTWFSIWNKQERDDQQAITLRNNAFDSKSDLVVIDIEFAVSVNKPYNKAKNSKGKNKVCRFDIIAVDFKGQLYVIELKQNRPADGKGNSANVKIHRQDFDDTIGNDVNHLLAEEMAQVVKIKKELGILPANVKVDTTRNPIFAVAYSGKDPETFNSKYRKEGICVIEVLENKKLRK